MKSRDDVLAHGHLPELGELHEGKVRDNHVVGDKRVLVATDRISAFDRVLPVLIPDKGAILNAIAMWWFEKTRDLVPNHVIDWPDPNVIVARQVEVFPVEMVVRGYLTGSAWRDVESGQFENKYGFAITPTMVEGGKLVVNCRLKEPIVTPTTKAHAGHDEPLTPEAAHQLVGDTYDELVNRAVALYERGAQLAEERGLLLVDTKYEFGEKDGEILLVDEVHTPDSSRYWLKDQYKPGREMVELSKQFVRDLLQKSSDELTERDVEETRRRYAELYERLTGELWRSPSRESPIRQRVVNHLARKGYIQGGYVQILAGSAKDDLHVEKLKSELETRKIPCGHRALSAHKNTRELLNFIETLDKSIEPVVIITVAGGSDALSGVVAHHSRFPVIACPPYKDEVDYLVNVHSTIQMPSNVPVLFCKRPGNTVLAAERILESASSLFAERI
jgi:phosphoribosylaminoimidazole-succinocarboxamide synthase